MKEVSELQKRSWIIKTSMISLMLLIQVSFLVAQVNVTLYPTTVKEIGGYSEVQGLFGVMANPGNPTVNEYLKEANVTGVRSIIKVVRPGDFNFMFPPWTIDKPEKYRLETRAQAEAWSDEFFTRDPEPLWTQQLRSLDAYFDGRFGNVNIAISGNPRVFDARMERNLEASKDHVIAYLNAIKQIEQAEGSDAFKFFQLSNEPEQARSWSGYFDVETLPAIEPETAKDSLYLSKDLEAGSASYVRVFNFLYDHVTEEHPDILFIGNCVGHDGAYRLEAPEKKPGLNWDAWVKHYIDQVENPGALAYFNPQTYRIPILRNLAYTSMTQSYAWQTRGVKPRYVITETNGPADGDRNYYNQLLFNAADIFMMLENPDKYDSRYGFIASVGNSYNFFNNKNGEIIPQTSYWVLERLKNLRGTNVDLHYDNTVVKVFASAPSGDRIVLGLFNPSVEKVNVKIHTGIDEELIKNITYRESAWSDELINSRQSEAIIEPRPLINLELQPVSINAIEIDLKETMEMKYVAKTHEHYASKSKTDMQLPVNTNIKLAVVPKSEDNAYLRVALHNKPQGGMIQIKLNGNTYQYDTRMLPDKKIETWHEMVGFIEIPVKTEHLKESNSLTIQEMPGNIMLYASIIIREEAKPLTK